MPSPRRVPRLPRPARPGFVARASLLAFATGALVAACVSSEPAPTSPGGAAPGGAEATAVPGRPATFPTDLPVVATVPPTSTPAMGEVPAGVVAAARADLAGRIGSAAAGTAAVVRSEAVTWANGSLGCPQPGVYYEQVEIAGYHVVFEVDGARYDYRATVAGNVVACEQGGPRP
jgi:hypothetical protein